MHSTKVGGPATLAACFTLSIAPSVHAAQTTSSEEVATPGAQVQSPSRQGAASSASPVQTAAGLETIVVTAQKRQQLTTDVGLTITAVDTAQLAELGIRDSADLTKVVSAFTVATSPDGTPVYTLRGIGYNSPNLGAQPTVSVYVDEAGLPYGPLTQGPLFDLERVEVLKGPQGTLFGQNSTGGAINYVVATPTDEFTGGVRVGYGRFNTWSGDVYVSGPVSDKLLMRAAATATKSDEWQESYLNDNETGKAKKYAGRVLLDWRPIDDLKVSVNLNGWKDRSDNQIPQLVVAAPRVPAQALPGLLAVPLPPRDNRDASWDPDKDFDRDNEFEQAVVRLDWTMSDRFTLTSISNYARVTVDSRYDHDGTQYPLGDVTTNGHVDVFTQEVRLAGEITNGNFLLGANYQTDDSREFARYSNVGQSAANTPFGDILGVENRGFQSNDSYAVFANAEWNWNDRLTLVGGARYTSADHDNRACSGDTGAGDFVGVVNQIVGAITGSPANFLPGECITMDENFDNAFVKQRFSEDNVSWRAGLNYKPTNEMLVYGLVSRGYKSGNYPVINATSRSQFVPVKQEELTSYEVGVKAAFPRIQASAAAFYYDYKDKQLLTQFLDPLWGLLPILANVPKSEAYGAEFDVVATPVSGLTLRAAAGYVRTEIGDFGGYDVFGTPVDLTGKGFNFSPEWTALGDVEYRFPVSAAMEAFIGGDVTYNGSTYGDLAESPELKLKSYTLVGLRAGIAADDDSWQVMLWGRNIFDEFYATNATVGIDTIWRVTGFPTTYGITVGFNF